MSSATTREARRRVIDTVEIGDLVRVNTTLRVVRDVTKIGDRVRFVTLSILRCSWTRKAYTVYNCYDLSRFPFEIVHRNYGLGSSVIERFLQAEIEAKSSKNRVLECCDVIGLVW